MQLTLFMMSSNMANIQQSASGLTRPPRHHTYKFCTIKTRSAGSLAAASSPEFQTCPSSSGCQCIPSLQDKKWGMCRPSSQPSRHEACYWYDLPDWPDGPPKTDATCIRHTLHLSTSSRYHMVSSPSTNITYHIDVNQVRKTTNNSYHL